MNREIVLYTPATGFPDLEAKIAYGLARTGLETGAEVSIIPLEGLYKIIVETEGRHVNINNSFHLLLKIILSSQRFYDLGVKAKDKTKYPSSVKVSERLSKIDLVQMYQRSMKSDFEFTKSKQCGHKALKFGATKEDEKQLGGLIILASVHAGKPQYRDNRMRDLNLGLCDVCGYLNVLGKESFCFTVQLGTGKNRKFVIITPIPNRTLGNLELTQLLSTQKTLHNFWLSDLVPLDVFTLGLLAKVPSLSDLVNNLQLDFHLPLLSKDNRGDTVVEQTEIVNTIPFAKFISRSGYNSATVDRLIGTYNSPPKIRSLIEITHIIKNPNILNLSKVARIYVQETSPKNSDWVNLIYPVTAKYLLREVAMIKPEIIKNEALRSLARTLRYFVRNKKYHYADSLRNARKESKDFDETIVKMLREAELRRIQEEEKKKAGKKYKFVNIPSEEEIKEVFQLANENFDEVKTAIVLLGLSFPSKGEEKIEEEVSND